MSFSTVNIVVERACIKWRGYINTHNSSDRNKTRRD